MRSIWINLSIVTIALVVLAAISARNLGSPVPNVVSLYAVISLFGIGIIACIALMSYIFVLMARGEERPAKAILEQVRFRCSAGYLVNHIVPIFLTFATLGAFSSLKVLIPTIYPFAWDSVFSDMDRVLFFGADPWKVTHAFIGPLGTAFLDSIYGLWLPSFAAVIVGVSLFASDKLKRQFFLSFFTIWIGLGLILATILSSAGPVFLDLISHAYATRYTDLFPLENAPSANIAQAYLAQGYLSGGTGFAKGISAMPSIHVAIAALYVCAFWPIGRIARAASLAFYLLILVGSVHLGWHYAWDGIVGTLGTYAIWKFYGRERSRRKRDQAIK
tara:strand:+ start:92 stop:1087 length:996 start_codon:yes stop_codon:yes gene_type:complete